MSKKIKVTNLDKLEERVVGVNPVIEDPIYEELREYLLSFKADWRSGDYSPISHDQNFTILRLIAENPEKARTLLEDAIESQAYLPNERYYINEGYRIGKYYLERAKPKFLEEFEKDFMQAPRLWLWRNHDLLVALKDKHPRILRFFQECYEETLPKLIIASKLGGQSNFEKLKQKFETIIYALKTKDFSYRGPPDYLELKVVPKEEILEVPDDIYGPLGFSKYLTDLEGTSPESVSFIMCEETRMEKATIIPRKNDPEWTKGVYIVVHHEKRRYKVYKTEEHYPDEEIIKKTTGKGSILRYNPEHPNRRDWWI